MRETDCRTGGAAIRLSLCSAVYFGKKRKNFEKALAFPAHFWYYIKAFRTGADLPHVAHRTDGLGRRVDAARRNRTNNKLEEIKCLSYP